MNRDPFIHYQSVLSPCNETETRTDASLADLVLQLTAHRPGQVLPSGCIRQLFGYMDALYAPAFSSEWKGRDNAVHEAQWEHALCRLPDTQLVCGIRKLRLQAAAPMLSGFLRLCRELVDPQAAYFEAVAGVSARDRGADGEWSDPAIYWAAVAIGAFDLKTQPYAQIRRRWETALAAQLAQDDVPPVPSLAGGAADRCSGQCSPDAARKAVAELRAVVSGNRQAASDHKRWARRIRSRIAEGDAGVTCLQAQAAKQALE